LHNTRPPWGINGALETLDCRNPLIWAELVAENYPSTLSASDRLKKIVVSQLGVRFGYFKDLTNFP
jgi:hypothetical protein